MGVENRITEISSPITMPPEVEVQRKDALLETTTEAPLVVALDFAVHDLERNVFVGRARVEHNGRVFAAKLLVNLIGRCLRGIDEVRIKYVELVTLYNLGRRVVVGVVRLVVLVPTVARFHLVEVLGLARAGPRKAGEATRRPSGRPSPSCVSRARRPRRTGPRGPFSTRRTPGRCRSAGAGSAGPGCSRVPRDPSSVVRGAGG